ncbi:MAG: 3-oxoacyl-[acyl-carrier-protein] reductase [Candidatus Muiribacteriota bacterium]
MLDGKLCVVTGAARGIGYEIAKVFAQKGADLALIDINFEDDFHFPYGEYRTYCLDITDYKNTVSVISEIVSDFKKIDILINNAGITKDNLFLRMKPEDWNKVIDVNLNGVFNVTKASLKTLIKNPGSSVINISSVIGLTGNAGQSNYSASKAGVIGLTRSLARELSARNVRVNAVAPGFIETAMTEKLSEKQKDAILGGIPLGKMGSAEEVAKACLFLGSDMSSYVTGQVLAVDGGMTMY